MRAAIGQAPRHPGVRLTWMMAFALLDSRKAIAQKLAASDEVAALARIVQQSPPPVLADEEMGRLVLADQPIAGEPFDLTQLVQSGGVTEEPLVAARRARRFRLVLVATCRRTAKRR